MDTSTIGYTCSPDPGGWFESWGNGNTVIIFSHNPFTDSTIYTFEITSAKDLEGNDLAPGTIPNPWTFTTTIPIPPTMINAIPENRETEVALDKNIIVIFSEPMDTSSVTYTCTPDPGGWDIGWSSDNMIATISHNPFAIGTTYNFHITGGKDINGNNLTLGLVPHSWNFTTISIDSLIVTPSEVKMTEDGTVVLISQAYDSQNNPIPGITYVWSISNDLGTISPQGSQIVTFKGSTNGGICCVNITAGGKSASAIVTIKSEDIVKDKTEDSSPQDIPWLWFLILVIIVLCGVNLWLVLRKERQKDKEELDSGESIVPEETVDESSEGIEESTQSEPKGPPSLPPDSQLPPLP